MNAIRRLTAVICAGGLAVVAATAGGAPGPGGTPGQLAKQRLATCFWEGPISTKRPTTRGFDGRNFNFPEESATYWMARFKLPEGAAVELRGRYPHARYMSLNSYSDGTPTDALSDTSIEPLAGSTNPFHRGARRDLKKRAFEVTVLDAEPPAAGAAREPNTIYASSGGSAPIELFYRVYEPDRGLGLTAGTGLPVPELRLADGSVLAEEQACAQINDADREIPVQTIPAPVWQNARKSPGCDPQTNPAYDPVRWERFFNLDYASLAVISDCTQPGREARLAMQADLEGGLYSNRDSAYIYAHLSRGFGPLVVVEGTLPRFPRTSKGPKRMPGGQLRFWSLCTGESRVTVRTPDCLADRQVLSRSGRDYTIVVSKAEDRPSNATRPCGVAWLDWGAAGDGAGDPNYSLLIMRNMLVSPTFARAIQRVERPGEEPAVMGRFFPRSDYSTVEEFEARGCPGR